MAPFNLCDTTGKLREGNETAKHQEEFIFYYNQVAKPIKWTYTVEKLEKKLGTLL